jgi:hypothetical protein
MPGAEVRCGEPRLAALVHQCVFNDPAGQEVNPVLADIHLRVLRNLRFLRPCLPALEPDNLAGCTSAPVPRTAVCPTARKMEPQITQNTQSAAVPYRARTMCSTSRSKAFPRPRPLVSNDHEMLVRGGKPRLVARAPMRFIDFPKKSSSQRVHHRQGAANNSFGQEVNLVLAGIHLRALRVLRFHFPCLQRAQPFQFVGPSSAAKTWMAGPPGQARWHASPAMTVERPT